MSKNVFLGVEGSGKTTLMMALAKELERRKADGLFLKPLSRDSFRFLKMLPEKIGEGSFPHQTASLRDLSWEIEENGVAVSELSVLDYPGEIYRLAFLDAKDESDPESFRQKVAANKAEIDALLNAVKAADNIYVLFNLADAEDLGGNSKNLDAVWVTNACLHLLKRLESKPSFELLFTQADSYESAGIDLASFSLESLDLIGHDHADVLWRFVSSKANNDSKYGIVSLVEELVPLHQRKMALRLKSFDFSSCCKFEISFWRGGSRKCFLKYFDVEKAKQVVYEAAAFYDACTPMMQILLNREFNLAITINDAKRLFCCFSTKSYGKEYDFTKELKAFESEYGQAQAKEIIARIEYANNAEPPFWLLLICCFVPPATLFSLPMMIRGFFRQKTEF